MVNSIYLETTALIDLVLKGWHEELLQIVKTSDELTTSQYSKMEIQKGFLKNLILLFNKANQCNSIERVYEFISNLSRSPNRYYLGACVDAMYLFERNYSNKRPKELSEQYGNSKEGEIRIDSLKRTLRTIIRRCFHRIDKAVKETYNPMSCFTDLEEPKEDNGMFLTKPSKCSDSNSICSIKNYFIDNKTSFEQILIKLESLEEKDDETKRRIKSLKEILKMIRLNRPFSNHDDNYQLCWDCSDAVHAVIAPHTIITSNMRHFKPICDAIGKSVQGYSVNKI